MKNMKIFSLLPVILVLMISSLSAASFLPKYSEFKLKNGLRVIMVEDHRQPMVNFRMNITAGSSCDSAKPGLTVMVLEILKENTKNYPDGQMNLVVDSMGGSLITNVGRTVSFITGDFLSRDLETGLNCLGDMVMHADFRDQDINRMRRRLISILGLTASAHSDVLVQQLYEEYYGSVGYGLSPYGTVAGLQDITRDDIVSSYTRNYRPNDAELIIGGDFDKNTLKKLLHRIFDAWTPGDDICQPISSVHYPDSLEIYLINNPGMTVAEFVMGRPAIVPDSSDYAKLLVLNYILGGGGKISRLYQDLVRDAATCNFINSSAECSRLGGMFYVHGGAFVESSVDALQGVLENMKMLGEIKIPVAELQETKNYFSGSQIRNYASFADAVDNIATNAACGQKVKFPEQVIKEIDKLTPDQLRDFARDFFNPAEMTIFVAGPAEKLKRSLNEIAPVNLMSLGSE